MGKPNSIEEEDPFQQMVLEKSDIWMQKKKMNIDLNEHHTCTHVPA